MRSLIVVVGVVLSIACAGEALAACQAPRVLIVLDKSSSMTKLIGSQDKWSIAKSAISSLLQTYQSSIDFGLMIYPTAASSCGPGAVKVPVGPNKASAIMSALSAAPLPASWTPTAQTLEAVVNIKEMVDPTRSNNVLLITDGEQWCSPYTINNRFQPVEATQKLAALGIHTYAVGFASGVDPLALNKIAEAGMTKISPSCDPKSAHWSATNNCYYQANDLTQLASALKQIAKDITTERCDGMDNDCNGLIDDTLTRSCSSACGTGEETCLNGSWGACSAAQPSIETCDGKDNNCDGTVDEGCACIDEETLPCGSSTGECKPGTQTCAAGAWGECAGGVTPATESCDGKDNDCDGQIDEELTRECQSACGPGVETCRNGSFEGCTALQPTEETCDGEDNDCDGLVDGPTALCEEGGVCLNGTCQAPMLAATPDAAEGCDCRMVASSASSPLPLLLGAPLLGLVLVRRRIARLGLPLLAIALAAVLLVAACGGIEDPALDEDEFSDDEGDEGKDDSLKGKPKIQIEVDFIGRQRFESGTIPLLKKYFSSIGYQLVIEKGDVLPEVENLVCGSKSKAIQSYYLKNFRHRGQKNWWYMLMADSLDGGIGGWGMMGGNVSAISDKMGNCRPGDKDPIRSSPLCRVQSQAHIIMHELGHNLTLTHEGFDPEKSAHTHNGHTCASAPDHPKDILPITKYSPACVAHIKLDPKPLLP